MSNERLSDVLGAHEFMPCATHTPTVSAWWAQCEGCDWKGPRRTERATPMSDHHWHVEAAILAWIGERLSDPETVDHIQNWVPLGFEKRDPYRTTHEAAQAILLELSATLGAPR